MVSTSGRVSGYGERGRGLAATGGFGMTTSRIPDGIQGQGARGPEAPQVYFTVQESHRETIGALEAEIPRLRRFARYMTRDADYADDLVQECLARAIANIASWQPGTNLRAWLFVILKNVFRNDKRREKHEIAHLNRIENDAVSTAPAQQHAQLMLSEIQEAFLLLSEDHREVLMLIAIEGLRYEEAAQILNISVGTVKSRLSRARNALRTLVDASKSEAIETP